MKNLHIEDSYNIWNPSKMIDVIKDKSYKEFNSYYPEIELRRIYVSMFVEWWLHNIIYYITKPFCFIEFIYKINLRCKDVDINSIKLCE